MLIKHTAPYALLAAATLLGRTARAEDSLPKGLENIGIVDRAGTQVPLDIRLTDQDGHTVTLADYTQAGKPLVVVLAYYECPMLCTVVLNGLKKGMSDLAWTAGQEYRVVTVSFDPRDKAASAKQKRERYVASYGRPVAERGWDFLIGDADQVHRLAEAVGFRYRWEEDTLQFAHAAGAFVLTPTGRVSRTLIGVTFPANDLRLALLEAAEGKLGSPWDRITLFCYHYDPKAGSYVLAGQRIMRVSGVLTLMALALLLGTMWRREAGKARAQKTAPTETAT